MHRDLKLENFAFTEDFLLQVIDPGFVLQLNKSHKGYVKKEPRGTANYMAPEMFLDKKYSLSVDIFSLGVVLLMMAKGGSFKEARKMDPIYCHFFENKEEKFWEIMSQNEGEEFFSDEFKGLVSAMLAVNPILRPSVSEVKAHKWFNGPVPEKVEI